MGIHLGRVGHIGIHVSDVDRSIDFYRRVLNLKLTGRWGPPDIGRPICFMRIDDKHHDVVLFELPEDARRAGVAVADFVSSPGPRSRPHRVRGRLTRGLAAGPRSRALMRR